MNATESSCLVQTSAGGFVEDGLGADRLNRKFRSSGCTRYSARVLMTEVSVLDEAYNVSYR